MRCRPPILEYCGEAAKGQDTPHSYLLLDLITDLRSLGVAACELHRAAQKEGFTASSNKPVEGLHCLGFSAYSRGLNNYQYNCGVPYPKL